MATHDAMRATSPRQREKAAKLYKAGHSTRAVADEMGLSRTRVDDAAR